MPPAHDSSSAPPRKSGRRYVPAVGPRLKRLLFIVFVLFALLTANSLYLSGVTLSEAVTGETYQNRFYMDMFIAHLVLGALIVVPVLLFGVLHAFKSWRRPNRRAVRVGYGLFAVAIILLGSGVILTRLEGVFEINDATTRSTAYWVHVITPLLACWLFVLHRLAGNRINWQIGLRWGMVTAAFGVVMLIWQMQDPRQWNTVGPDSGESYFRPSLARTASGGFIPEKVLANDAYCQECHEDSHFRWAGSAHRFSSFNNPPYLFSVRETRRVAQERDGDMQAARFCAGCHDPVVFFSGKFDDPDFDDENDPAGKAGVTCTVCHAITHVNSVRGNADYTIEEPIQYPFAASENKTLRWVSNQLVKAKPDLHKKTFLKPLHKSPEFCGTCHKVHLPKELNKYKWLRAQNHYDSYLLSGVSGHGVSSFYYPEKSEPNCNGCHMPLLKSEQFSAQDFDASGESKIHDHLFQSANTGIAHLLGLPPWVNDAHRDFNDGVVRLDLFGLRDGSSLNNRLIAPLRPNVPRLRPGNTYLLDVVIRTLKMGHLLTEGTGDSNELWLDVLVKSGNRVIGRSGGLGERNAVDPWSHFVNTYMLDRDGNRIDRRNAQDIFVPLYNNQVAPGAADVVHYRLSVPSGITSDVTVEIRLQYRKFDTTLMSYVYGDDFVNDLPIITLASDRITFPLNRGRLVGNPAKDVPEWERWNDYGIGMLLKGGKTKGQLRNAEMAFARVEQLGRSEGPLNLARVYVQQGTVQDRAIEALQRAGTFRPPAPSWSVAWFTGLVNRQNGFLDEAIANFESIVALDDTETRGRGLDFSQDYRLLNELGQAVFERARQERGDGNRPERDRLLGEARGSFERALALDPE
ncbi:MAG: hypothetical protein HOH43_12250, partial [Candidatus Latescibacteria bacterium]|nr:hypothetical protein [Candidatus Latescibacterota bacterium]